LKHTVPVITDAHVLQTLFYTTWVRGVAYEKKLLGQTSGVWAKGASKKLGPPTYFCKW